MTSAILSPYKLFLTDCEDNLWALMQDNRLRFVKKIGAFAGISSHEHALLGVKFLGDKTQVLITPCAFDSTPPTLFFTHKGYAYHPALYEDKTLQMAMIQADLLSPKGEGELVIFERARSRFRPIARMPVKMAPVRFDTTGDVYALTPKNDFVRMNGHRCEKIAGDVGTFSINPMGTILAYAQKETLHVVIPVEREHKKLIAFDVTALGVAKDNTGLYFATFKEGKSNLYFYDFHTKEVALCAAHTCAIKLIVA